MNVLLINPHTFWISEGNTLKLRSRSYYDNLSIRYLASALENAGHTADIIDAHFEEISLQELIQCIGRRARYDLYGISCTQKILEDALYVASYIKSKYKNALIIAGGYGPTLLGKLILSESLCFDIAMIGEAERAILDLVKYIQYKNEWSKIPNIYYRDGDHIVRTKAAKTICNLNELAWPKRADQYPLGKANMLASRGCYGQCTYCSITEFHKVSLNKRFRFRSAIDVVDEMEYLFKNKNVYYFDFVDDSFVTICRENQDWADLFISELERRKLNLIWGIQSRANDIDYELFKKLHKVGLRAVSIGIENNVQRIIKLFRTGTNYEIHKQAIDTLKQLNISYFIEMIMLEPLTTLEEIKENLNFLNNVNYCDSPIQNPISFSPKLELYTGTPIIKEYEGLAVLHYTKYSVEYEFVNHEVTVLRSALLYWQKITGDIAAIHLTYQYYHANKEGKIGLALQIVKLSMDYLAFDLELYNALVDYLLYNSNCTIETLKAFFEPYEKRAQYYRLNFQRIYDELN